MAVADDGCNRERLGSYGSPRRWLRLERPISHGNPRSWLWRGEAGILMAVPDAGCVVGEAVGSHGSP